jgi:hypothetical protein
MCICIYMVLTVVLLLNKVCVYIYRSSGVGSKRSMDGIHHPTSNSRAKQQKLHTSIDPDALSLSDEPALDDDDEEKIDDAVSLQRLFELITLADRYCIEDVILYTQCWSKVLRLTTVHNLIEVWEFSRTLHSLHPSVSHVVVVLDCALLTTLHMNWQEKDEIGELWENITTGLLQFSHIVLNCDKVAMAIVNECPPDRASVWSSLADAVQKICL